jgi:prevent-host-death family protein
MTWQLQEAKNKLSEVARRAESDGPQEITRHGRQRFVLATIEDWEKRSVRKRGKNSNSLREFYARYKSLDLKVRRRKDKVPSPADL